MTPKLRRASNWVDDFPRWRTGFRISATFYTTEYSDQQVQSASNDPVTGNIFFNIVNAAQSTVRGF